MVAPRKKGTANRAKKPSKVAPVYIWGGAQDEAERVFIDAYAGGIAYDVESTGLGPQAEVTEIALVQICTGTKLFESRVRPAVAKMEEEAQRITGISDAMLKSAPSWLDIEEELLAIIGNSMLVAWSGERPGDRPFDSRLCAQSHEAAGLGKADLFFMATVNIKPYHRAYRQVAYGNRLHSSVRGGLDRALLIEGLKYEGKSHGALVDAMAVAAVVKACCTSLDGNKPIVLQTQEAEGEGDTDGQQAES